MKKIPKRNQLIAAAAIAASAVGATYVVAHQSDTEGHIAANVNYGFTVIGRDTLAGIQDGRYTDVWSHNGYAYIGTFQNPDCSQAGVYVVDMNAAIANYGNGDISGATVAEIKSAPNTRINDVKVHRVGDVDVLITTQEPCGSAIPGAANAGGVPLAKKGEWRGTGPSGQLGQGGISLYDVSDPTKPKALKKNFLEYGGVHNTYAWDYNGKSYLIGTADTFDFFDTFFVDITKPHSPTLLSETGALDWLAAGAFADGQFSTGSSAGLFTHDVWVDFIDGVPTAVVSYWDMGFVTLDVTDPANPVFLRDSTYVSPEPIVGQPYEGNAHAAVFGGSGDYIFGGDEDFSDSSFAIDYAGSAYGAGQALFGPSSLGLAGNVIWTGGEGCTAAEIPAASASGQVALIQRGSCFFQDKASAAEAQGYAGFIVANTAANGDDLLNMAGGGTTATPTIPGVFVGYTTGEIMKANPGQAVAASSIFDGWGYLHVINNTDAPITVQSKGMMDPSAMITVQPGGELGYYSPAEAVEPLDPANGPYGDLTMHNIEADPLTQGITPSFDAGPRMFVSWYSLGMRALEYRPGHFHANMNGEGSYSMNVHEVGRYIADDGSNYWGVHLDTLDDGSQVILASDRNTGLWLFTFSCETKTDTGSVFYCDPDAGAGG